MKKIPLDAFQDLAPPPKPPARAKGLLSLHPRDTRKALALSETYTRAVAFFRWFLPLLAFLVLIALIAWPMMNAQKITSIVADNIPNLVVENLRLSGLDAKNQPYSLTADRALQAIDVKNVIELEKPQGDIALEGGAWIAGKAESGRFDQTNKNLWLGGKVQVFHDLGYEFSTSEAHIDLGQSTAWGEQPVLVQGSFGAIEGQGFEVQDKGNVVIIKGPAKALLDLQAKPPSDKTKANKALSPQQESH